MANDNSRLPPEHFLTLIREQQKGRLKVYLGFAPGVGKTYEMLQEAQRLKRQGVDVVVGVVETHGRSETAALLEGLKQVPRRRITYKDHTLEEMDLDALLARRPTVALVDELAHTNAPGSRNPKRYQDVEELLRAGINVISTLNIQHLESLYDLVEQATGVRVKERVPDYVLAMADQLVNVDLSAEDLRERLEAGKVYPKERVQTSLDNFFTMPNLMRLRELTLGEAAHLLDRRRREQNEGSEGNHSERVMACVGSRSPNPAAMLRKAMRVANRLNVPWYAVYIQTPGEAPEKVGAIVERHVANALNLAHQLGGVPMKFKGPDVVSTISAFAKEYGITLILIGRSLQPWYKRIFREPNLQQLLRAVPGVDVLVVDTR